MTKGIFIFVIGISAVMFGLNVGMSHIESRPTPPETRFEVIDKYKECDVVRYAPHQVAEYKYFLYCPK